MHNMLITVILRCVSHNRSMKGRNFAKVINWKRKGTIPAQTPFAKGAQVSLQPVSPTLVDLCFQHSSTGTSIARGQSHQRQIATRSSRTSYDGIFAATKIGRPPGWISRSQNCVRSRRPPRPRNLTVKGWILMTAGRVRDVENVFFFLYFWVTFPTAQLVHMWIVLFKRDCWRSLFSPERTIYKFSRRANSVVDLASTKRRVYVTLCGRKDNGI